MLYPIKLNYLNARLKDGYGLQADEQHEDITWD